MALLGMSRAFFSLAQTGGAMDEGAQIAAQQSLALSLLANIWIPSAFLLMALGTISNAARRLFYFTVPTLVVTLVAGAYGSAPPLALKETIRLLLCLSAGAYIASTLNSRQILLNIFCTSLFILISSVFISLLLPNYGQGLGMHVGSWLGAFPHKNHLGRFSAFFLLLTLLVWRTTSLSRGLLLSSAILALLLSYKSHSANAAFLTFTAIPIALIFSLIQNVQSPLARIALRAWTASILFVAVLVGIYFSHEILSTFGKGGNLSGRAEIWSSAWAALKAHPILGYGISAYWPTHPTVVLRSDSYIVPHAHNGYLDLGLSIGFLGSAVLLISAFAYRFSLTPGPASPDTPRGIILGSILTFFALVNILESTLLGANIYLFLAFIFSAPIKDTDSTGRQRE